MNIPSAYPCKIAIINLYKTNFFLKEQINFKSVTIFKRKDNTVREEQSKKGNRLTEKRNQENQKKKKNQTIDTLRLITIQ